MTEKTEFQRRKARLATKIMRWVAALSVVVLVGGFYAYWKFFHEVDQVVCGDVEPDRRAELCADDAEERFKYGSLGAEWELGVPYPMFHVLPRVFADLMPGPGGYRAFGLPWEEGRELPVGFSKKTVGFPRITQTCAVCHAASYRVSPDAKPVIVPTGPAHTTNVMAVLDFLEAAANDPRWSGDGMLAEMSRNFDLGWDDKLIYRLAIIPIAKKRVLEQAADFAWMHAEGRPPWGPGRDGPFNLTKFNLIGLDDDGTVDNSDFPAIWNANLRENTSMNWAGETQDPLAVYIDSALGLGSPPEDVTGYMEQTREYLRAKQPPAYPFPVDAALAAEGLRQDRAHRRNRHRPRTLRHLAAGSRRRDQCPGRGNRCCAQEHGQGYRLCQPAAGRYLAARALSAQRVRPDADRSPEATDRPACGLLAGLRHLRPGRRGIPRDPAR